MAKLNREQAEAASTGARGALVLAGPGTGKTSTLAARHSFLRKRGADPESILVATFTQRAAEELRARLGPSVPARAWVGTFHGLSARLLRRFAGEAGLSPSFRILDTSGSRQALADAGVRWDEDDGSLVDIIGRWKDSLLDPAAAAASVAGRGGPMVAAAAHYAAYEEELARRGDVDFADLVRRATGLVRSSAAVGSFVSSRFGDVLVDEFQDVNLAQAEFVSALAARGPRVWAVADDDQSLYGWRGGDVRLTVNFGDRFHGAASYALRVNYRCAPAVLAAASALIAHNRTRLPKELVPARAHDPASIVRVRTFDTERKEADFIASEARRLVDGGMAPSAIAVLFRTASVAPAIQQALEMAGLPFTLTGASSFWGQPEVSAVVSLLAAVEAGDLSSPSARHRIPRDLVETMKGSPPSQCAPAVGRAVAATPPAGAASERAALWADCAEAAATLAQGFPSAAAFAAHVSEMESRAASGSSGGIAVTTVHSSKGLEWSHVFVAGAEAKLMPHHRADDVEEERRLAYVALTRSKGAVDVTMSKIRFGRSALPSPFLAEMAKAPRGCVAWPGGPAGPERPAARAGGAPARAAAPPAKALPQRPGRPATFRKRGGRSLIAPGEEDA